MKAYILTFEAFLSLLVVILLIFSLPLLLVKQKPEFGSFILLSDAFEVLEKGYHDSLANWMDFGISDPRLNSYFEFIQNNTGKRFQIEYNGKILPNYNCVSEVSMRRLVITSSGAHNTIAVSLCK